MCATQYVVVQDPAIINVWIIIKHTSSIIRKIVRGVRTLNRGVRREMYCKPFGEF